MQEQGNDKEQKETNFDESFRDSIATINEEGKRNWIYPKKPKGKLYTARGITSIVYLILLFGLPFIKVNGEPLFLLNVLERKFILFGVIFWPQDFILFGLGMLTFLVFIVLFTVAFGRLFCGWACPQTVFMEMIFRKIEYWIEGDGNEQKKLAAQPWNGEKIKKKSLKWSIFYVISFIIANTFLAYIIGVDELFKIITEPVAQHTGGLVALLIFTTVFFFVFAWFREQACLIVCPYGRLQGVMLDKNSIVVAYDYVRGEPRHKLKKGETEEFGDCVDCALCVKVCPTGIDIRNGTQLECVNCTACIDACDEVMEKVHRPKGLIRYDSEEGIKSKTPLKITRRLAAYSAVLTLLVGILVTLLVTRTEIETKVLRAGGQTFQGNEATQTISNLYNVSVINKSRNKYNIEFKIENKDANIRLVGQNIVLQPEGKANGTFFIDMSRASIEERKTKLEIGVYANGEKLETVKTNFLGPVSKR
jgi:cytochrome c oxidase accessory protein FixG